MCGIAGVRGSAAGAPSISAQLAAATRSIAHRGPDDGDQWISENDMVGLGHRRLSIIDLSSHGHQPMISNCGQWVMVFNGEVYNFKEIRRDLETLGHQFHGSGDSEVILAGFAQWGLESVNRLIGMFAIALWHKPTQELHLIRDRLGVKPLYYQWDGQNLCFGSELKALREFKHWEPEIDREAMLDYFRYGYIDQPRTIYRNVFKLPPAHRLVMKRDGRIELSRYWSPLAQSGVRQARSEASLTEELEALMVSAFGYRMIADVPVGVFLSGGVDSSLVAAILQKSSQQQIRTFTIGFDEDGFNEAPYAEAVAKHLGTNHVTRMLRVDEAMCILPGWGDLYDEPFADSSGIPQLLISRVAARDVKVVLSADGGDEMFSGYNTYETILQRLAKLKSIPGGVRSVGSAMLNSVPWHRVDEWLAGQRLGGLSLPARKTLTWQAIKYGERLTPQAEGRHFDLASRCFSDRELAELLGTEDALESRPSCDVYPGEVGDRMCLWDLEHYMAEDILTKVDRATMAASIEGREPLIDHRLVEFAFSIPFKYKRGSLGAKHLLKSILYKHVPRNLVERPKKGFSVPLGAWFAGDLRGMLRDYLAPETLRRHGLIDPEVVARLLRRLDAGDPLAVNRVWSVLAFQMWHQRWMTP